MQNSIILIDTNILMRYLLRDNEEQFSAAYDLIENNECVVLTNILQEVLYVLNGPVYNIDRAELKDAIEKTFDSVTYVDQEIIREALNVYNEKPKLDFPDCMLVAYKRLFDSAVSTFDEKLIQKLKKEGQR